MGRWTKIAVAIAALCAVTVLYAGPASGDGVYRSSHIALNPVGGASLRNGFVENIHANGPIVYAHEQYVLNGAAANTTYQVVLMVFPGDPSCSSSPLSIPVTTVQTNAAGNGTGSHVFTPADADGLRGTTVGGMWTVSAGGSPDYQTGCETIILD